MPQLLKEKSITHISCLKTGDRFYIWSDPKKTVWELRYHTVKFVRGNQKKYSVCKTDNGITETFDANRVIMFLRRTIPDRPKKEKEFSIDKYFA